MLRLNRAALQTNHVLSTTVHEKVPPLDVPTNDEPACVIAIVTLLKLHEIPLPEIFVALYIHVPVNDADDGPVLSPPHPARTHSATTANDLCICPLR